MHRRRLKKSADFYRSRPLCGTKPGERTKGEYAPYASDGTEKPGGQSCNPLTDTHDFDELQRENRSITQIAYSTLVAYARSNARPRNAERRAIGAAFV
jgi:hypothetical protein